VKITIPKLSLVVLVGPSSVGKSTFARTHFRPTEVLSSDFCRALVADDENDQSATEEAFQVLHFIAARRLARGRLTVVDATNVQPRARQPLLQLARRFHVPPVAIVFDLPEEVSAERLRARRDRAFDAQVVAQHRAELQRSIHQLTREGFRHVFILRSPEEVAAVEIKRHPLPSDRRLDIGPFDIIGDVHGCADELEELLTPLGYAAGPDGVWRHPEGRRAVFVGDLVDRGPRILDVLRLVMQMVQAGTAFCVPGNHDDKLMRKLRGRSVRVAHGLQDSLEQLEREPPEFRQKVADFIASLPSHYVFDRGRLVVAHAGMRRELQGRESRRVRDFALYGETKGETDEFGLPVRYQWAARYRGGPMVVYGHTPVVEPEWLNGTINIDTGCVFGGRLTALRYPERELVSVRARRTYAEPARPLSPSASASTLAG
jgi:polynucleotide kinase-phosphatase